MRSASSPLREGGASARVLAFGSNDLYDDLALELAEDGLVEDPDDLVFLENLQNGGDVGAGRRLLKKAAALAARDRKTLVAVAVADPQSDQPRLLRWYARLMHKIPGRPSCFSSAPLAAGPSTRKSRS